jgi:hypothetical protein
MDDWQQKAGFTELGLAREICPRPPGSRAFLDAALVTDEHAHQGLAWAANARVAIAAEDWTRAEECIAQALRTMEGYEVPLAVWRVHATAAELHPRAQNDTLAEHHRELSRAIFMKLVDSLSPKIRFAPYFWRRHRVRRVVDRAAAIRA